MAEAKTDLLVGLVETLLAEKQALAQKENELVQVLNSMLNRMGYEVVVRKSAGSAVGRGRKGRTPGKRRSLRTRKAAKTPSARKRGRAARKK